MEVGLGFVFPFFFNNMYFQPQAAFCPWLFLWYALLTGKDCSFLPIQLPVVWYPVVTTWYLLLLMVTTLRIVYFQGI